MDRYEPHHSSHNPYAPPVEPAPYIAPPRAVISDAPYHLIDPVSKSSMVFGIVGVILAVLPCLGIVGIILGAIAIGKSGQGRELVDTSAGAIRGRGMYLAGKALGIGAIIMGGLYSLIWLFSFMNHGWRGMFPD